MNAIVSVPMLPDRRNPVSRQQLLQRIQREFEEMPGLRLTAAQGRRLFGLRADVCDRLFRTLIAKGILICRPDARYGLRSDVMDRPRSASWKDDGCRVPQRR